MNRYSNLFSNLSSYEEFVMKCDMIGEKISNIEILSNFTKIEDYWFTVAGGKLLFLDNNGIRCEDFEIKGDFYCNICTSLTSLEGAPRKVGGSFDCSYCTSLTSLKGAPRKVGGAFNCSNCTSLTSLEGTPREVGWFFDCSYCTSLTSLEGAPRKVGGDFIHDDNLII